MTRYLVYDCFLGEYLPSERNWADDLPEPEKGWRIHIEDGAGLTGEKFFVATPPELPEELPECEVKVRFTEGYVNCEVYWGNLAKKGLLGGLVAGGLIGVARKKPEIGLLGGLLGLLIGMAKKVWKVRYL